MKPAKKCINFNEDLLKTAKITKLNMPALTTVIFIV